MMAKGIGALERRGRPPRGGVAGSERQRLAAKRGAFTLIELLVVIAIIALSMALLVPALSAPADGESGGLSNQAETVGDDPGPVCPGK